MKSPIHTGVRKKNLIVALIVLAELTLMLCAGAGSLRRMDSHEISQEELLLVREGYADESGFYVDGNFDGNGRAIATPYLTLGRGIWQVRVEHSQTGNPATLTELDENIMLGVWTDALNEYGTKKGLRSDRACVPDGSASSSWRIRVDRDRLPVRIICGIADRQELGEDRVPWILVDRVQLTRLPRVSAAYDMLGLMTLFIAADLIVTACVYRRRILSALRGRIPEILTAALCLLVSCAPLAEEGLPFGNDIEFHLHRIDMLAEGILNGSFPVRLQAGWFRNFGYAVGVMYPDALLYPAAVLRIAGVSLSMAYRLLLAVTCLATLIITSRCFRKISGSRSAGLFGAIFYVSSLYRLHDIYYRASLGEVLAMTFFPILLLGLWMLLAEEERTRRNAWLVLTLGAAGVIYSHVISILFGVCLGVTALVISGKRLLQRGVWKQLICFTAVTLCLGAAFLIPFLDYYLHMDIMMKHLNTGTLQNSAMSLKELLPYALPQLLCVAAAVILTVRRGRTRRGPVIALIVAIPILCLLSSDLFPHRELYATVPGVYHIASRIQFLWRLLAPAGVLSALLFTMDLKMLADELGERRARLAGLAACLMLILAAAVFCGRFEAGARRYATLYDRLPYGQTQPWDYFLYVDSDGPMFGMEETVTVPEGQEIETGAVDRRGLTIRVQVANHMSGAGQVVFPLMNFKGYRVTATPAAEGIAIGDGLFIPVTVPGGYEGELLVEFHEPPGWRLAELCSLVTLCLLAGYVLRRRRRP